ncbi:RING-H2 finger protein ATL56-like [Phragmites australis]|uniref:RING-H2 finger protein ATL56-like n=1 Tax=Phragmites australis TaxID=29695 RepID=UPI002D76C8C2|nr:RING-H2 finger protein ATL56-like [Phragmites australis]
MAPPPAGAGAGEPAHAATEPSAIRDRDAKRRRRPCPEGAGARIMSLGVQAAVMAAALALFVLFAAAAAVLLLILLVAARAFRHHHHRSRYRVPSLDPYPPASGLSPDDLRLLPSFAFSSPGDRDTSLPPHLCAVCLEAARAGERWRALPACGHAFHAACVDRWLAKSPVCPVCRAAVAVSVS